MSFDLAFDEIEKEITDNISKKSVKLASDVVEETRKYSGQLKASVNLALNNADLSIVTVPNYTQNAIQNIESSQRARFAFDIKPFKLGDTIIVSNNQPYARIYEFAEGDRMFGKAVQGFRL